MDEIEFSWWLFEGRPRQKCAAKWAELAVVVVMSDNRHKMTI